jgi:hypothetical protein
MDLYGSGVSIAQANQQSDYVRQLNQQATDFNNSLAEEVDQAKTALNEEQTDITTKNMASVATSGGKLLTSGEAREDVANVVKKVKGAPKALVSKSPFKLGVESSEDIVRVQSSATLPEGAAERGQAILAGEGAEGRGPAVLSRAGESLARGELPSVGEGVGAVSRSLGIKSAEELGAKGFAKTALAGVGGGIDIVKDIERGNFGSNAAQQVGNIGNIVGSALEIAGIATAWTPFGLGLEGIGAAISLGSAALETAGDIEEGKKEAETTESDIQGQARGLVGTEQVETAVGRTQ